MKGWTTMKRLKQVICGLLACLMLADPVSMCSTAYAEENEPAEPEAILQMAPVEQEGMPLLQEAEQQETSEPEQEVAETADTSAPELDVSSLKIEYDAKLGGEATLTYRVRSESKITVCWASIIVETSGGVRDDGLHMEHMVVDRTDIVARNAFTLAFYGTYQVQGIYIGDEQGNVARYYNSACSAYRGETPAVDMSAANIVLQSPIEDTSAPVIDLSSIRLEKNEILSGSENTLYVSVTDESETVNIRAQFMRETGQGYDFAENQGFTKTEDGRYALPITEDVLGKWQLFRISASDACGNATTYLNSAHPQYESWHGAENLCDLSSISFEVMMDSFATPVIDLTSLSIDKKISRNKGLVNIFAAVENSDSVSDVYICYRVTDTANQQRYGEINHFGYTAGLHNFRCWFWPSHFGKYEAEYIELLDYSGEWQYIYNSALSYDETLPENAVIYDLSGLNFDSVDAQIYTMEGLKAALAEAQDGERLQIAASENFVIDEDITIPKGVYLNIQSGSGSFKIAEGVTFTTESQLNCHAPMTVKGTWRNQSAYVVNLTISASGLIENNKDMDIHNFRVEGNLKNNEQAQIRSYENFELTSTGSLDNSGEIYLDGRFVLAGKVTEHPGSHIYHTYKAKTLGELKELLKQAKAGDTITVDPGGSAFVISEGISVQEGVRLNISGALVINAGVTFTTANLNVQSATVNGTWVNQGSAVCKEVHVADRGIVRNSQGNFYCWSGLRIAEGGLVENNGYFQIDEKYENAGALTNNAGATARLVLAARNVAELKAALACENPGEKEITFWVSDAVTLTEDTVIPENTLLFVYDSSGNGAATLTVGEGATLITDGHFDFTCDVPLTVAGKWVNHGWGVKLNEGLTITSTGSVDSTDGSIELTGAFINDGVLVKGSYIHQTLIVRSMDELKSAMQGVAPSGTVEILGNSDFIISEDITIPKGITVEVYEDIQNLRLDAGTKLTVDTGATLRSYTPVEVDGTVYNYGSIGARRGMTVNGTIHNYDYIRVEGGEFVGSDNVITHEAGMRAIRQNYFVDSEQALDEVLAEVDLGKWNWNTITVDEGFTLSGDVTIPRGVYLKVQSGTFKVDTGTKLVTYDNLEVAGNMVVNGHWTNNYGTAISSVAGELVVNGTVENGGHLELHQYTEAFQQKRIQNADRGRIDYNLTVYSLAELRNLIARGAYWPMSVYWPADDTVILDDDLSIPDNMSLRIDGQRTTLIIPEGVVLCTGTDKFDVSYGNVIVQGVLHTDGNCGFNTIEVSGLLENAGGLSFDNMLITDSGKVTNAGVMVGDIDNQGEVCNIDRTDAGKAFELELRRNCDWNDVFRNIRHGDSVRFTSFVDNSYIVVSEDTTLLEGVSLHCGNFKITEGVTLTTNGSMEDVSTINVDGVWVNNGIANAYNIAGTGTICNAGSIVAYEISDEVKITGRPLQRGGDYSVIYAHELDLQEVLDTAKRGQTVRCVRNQIYNSGQCGIIFNEDITVPEGVTLQFAGAFKVYFAANHTLIVNGTLVAAQPVYIAGSLVINGEVSIPAADEVDVEYMQYLGVAMGGINIVDGGACEINGSIRVGKTDYNGQSITDPFSVLEGVDTTTLTQRTVDGCWYLTKKTAEGKADIFCELPTAGCSLRLVGADGSMKELAPAGKGATITNIAPGQYTLEVSKPGYVTHSISVNTAAIADTFAVELVMVGDINGCTSEWGDVDVTDMACLYTLLSTGSYDGQIKDEEYMKRVADVNGDGMINILDYQRLYMALNGAKA